MNRASIISILCLALLSPSVFAELASSCRSQVIQKNQLDSIIERRAKTFKHCLVCAGDSCQLKKWPASGVDFMRMCKVLFCTPKKLPGSAILPEAANQDGSFHFAYTIGKDGRVQDIKITEISGGITPKTALKLANSSYKRRKYEPIIVNGKSYELTNLTDSIRLTVDYTVRPN
jgi:hypothetical protein